MRYTSQAVVESLDAANATYAPAWTPIVKGAFVDEGGVAHDAKFIAADDGAVTYLDATEDGTFNVTEAGRIAYKYDNILIPANDLPVINMKMEEIPLHAKARRISIYYAQIANFQAKAEYDLDMGKELAAKAVAELEFEIDEEIISFLANLGRKETNQIKEAVFNARLPLGVTMRDHYESFVSYVEKARVALYNRTQKFMPNFMLADPALLPILALISAWKPSSTSAVVGPYMAG